MTKHSPIPGPAPAQASENTQNGKQHTQMKKRKMKIESHNKQINDMEHVK